MNALQRKQTRTKKARAFFLTAALLTAALGTMPMAQGAIFNPYPCQNKTSEDWLRSCEMAKTLNIPVEAVRAGISLLSVEVHADVCQFTLSSTFFQAKQELLAIETVRKAYDYANKNKENNPNEHFANIDRKVCEESYEKAGPLAKEGNPVFYQ